MGSLDDSAPSPEPLAIIGLSCKFAGDATNPERFWQLLEEGRSAWSEIPSSRFLGKGAYHPNSQKLSTLHVRGGHFYEDDLANFDAAFFNYSAETASTLDPQFRLQLESVYEALENAGLPLSQVAGSNTSVFAGTFLHDYRESLIRDEDSIPKFFFTGTGSAMAANRISHFFDFRGASIALDTGCSSSLVALHQAVQSLRSGESDMSIVGGSNVLLNPDAFKSMGSLGLLSPDGKCFAFDSRANGYGRGEGVATVVLKRLQDAIASGDTVRAVIREIQTNQDGKTETITTPSKEAQQALMRSCYAKAGLNPQDTTYFEAHGTGTATGDPIEAGAVASIFRDATKRALRIGSVKTNIGHTEATSGLAGVIKVVLAMEKGKIPPSINFATPNPKLALGDWNLKVATQLEDWPTSEQNPRRASVNSFGYGGSNAHAILEQSEPWRNRLDKSENKSQNGRITDGGTKLLILSAKDEESCSDMITNLKTFLQRRGKQQIDDTQDYLENLIYTLGQRRTMFPWLAAYPIPISQAIDGVVSVMASPKFRPSRVSTTKPPRIGFVFTGQGAQWHAMGRELISYPVFRDSLLEADAYLREFGSGWSLMEELDRSAETTNVNRVSHSIPMCAAVQISLVRLLATWNIVPSGVTSHSSGEIAAAFTVGAISYRYAMGIAFHRSVLAAESIVGGSIKGGMIAVGLGSTESEAYLSQLHSKSIAVVACVNSPSSTTIAGDLEAIEELEQVLKAAGIFARRLRVEVAYHSHHMECIADEYREKLVAVAAAESKIRDTLDSVVFASPATGYCITSARQIANPNHWVTSLLQPVQFIDAMTEMILGDGLDDSPGGIDLLIEVGPHTALGGPIQQILELPEFNGLRLPYHGCLVRNTDAMETMQALVATLLSKGYEADVEAVNFPRGKSAHLRVLTDLPSYPWNHRSKHWTEPRTNKGLRQREEPPSQLLGSLIPGTNPNFPIWRQFLRPTEDPWLRDHVLQSNMIYPGGGFIALAIEALKQQSGLKSRKNDQRHLLDFHIKNFNVEKALLVPDSASGIEIQTMLRPASDKAIDMHGWQQFDIFSVTIDNQWALHATGIIAASHGVPYDSRDVGLSDNLRPSKYLDSDAIYSRHIDPIGMWDVLQELGIEYGPQFRNISSIVQSRKEMLSWSKISMSESSAAGDIYSGCLMHPATLDAIVQTTYAALPETDSRQESPRVLQSVQELWISHKAKDSARKMYDCFTLLRRADEQAIEADIRLRDSGYDDSDPLLEIKGLVFQSLRQTTDAAESRSWERNLCSKMTWASLQDPVIHFDSAGERMFRVTPSSAHEVLRRLVHETPDARILEIGTGALTKSLLDSIRSPETSDYDAFEYHFTSAENTAHISDSSGLAHLDGLEVIQELGIHHQGLSPEDEPAMYDIVIASQAPRNTDPVSTFKDIHRSMKPQGQLLFLNPTGTTQVEKTSVGDETQLSSNTLTYWNTAINSAGFHNNQIIVPSEGGECILSRASPLATPQLPAADKIALVVNDPETIPLEWVESLRKSVFTPSQTDHVLPTIYNLHDEKASYTGMTCIFLGELTGPMLRDIDVSTFAAIRKLATTCDQLLWVTRGAFVDSENPDLALAPGFIRSLRHEYLDRCYVTLDLDPSGRSWSTDHISEIVHVLRKMFSLAEFDEEPMARDFEYAVRDGDIWVPRLFKDVRRDNIVCSSKRQESTVTEHLHQQGRPLLMKFSQPASMDSLSFVEDDSARLALSQALSPELIEVEPRAYGVNLQDVIAVTSSGQQNYGLECSGIITRIGSDAAAHGYAAGDAVCCLLTSSFSSLPSTAWTNVMHMPATLNFEEAASLPLVYFTAYTCLVELARLQHGQTVLINAAAGGVGQAAIMIARHLGAEIYVTVGSPEERALLIERYKILADHIFNSRDTWFASSIRASTRGRGVDVVLNSLDGHLLQESFDLLAPHGYFLEIGTRDLQCNSLLGMRSFSRQTSFTAFSATSHMSNKPQETHHALSEVAKLLEAKAISPVYPIVSYPIADAVDAFRIIQTSSHAGKLVLSTGPKEYVSTTTRRDRDVRLSPEASYLLVGGLGGLGYSIAHWMIKNGAKNLIILSRSAGDAKSATRIDALRNFGCRTVPVSCDVANEADVLRALQSISKDHLPPIKGIIQSAMVLQDAVLEKMSGDQFKTTILPKVHGTWNLHKNFDTAGSLDFFVILSSVVAVIGNTSQVNYAAAGSFQDALARYRCAQGLPAVSIDLGAVKGIGVAAETAGILSRLSRTGFVPLGEHQVLALIGSAISEPFNPQIVVGLNSEPGRHWEVNGSTQLGRDKRFAALRPRVKDGNDAGAGSSPDSLTSKLNAASSFEEATKCVEIALVEKIADTFMIPAAEIDVMQPPTEYGIDSLVAVELRNMLAHQAKADVSIFTIMQSSSLHDLSSAAAAKSTLVKAA